MPGQEQIEPGALERPLLEQVHGRIPEGELGRQSADLHLSQLGMRDFFPGYELLAAALPVVPDQGVVVIQPAVLVVVLHSADVPELVVVPDGAEVEISEVGPVAKQRDGPARLTGDDMEGMDVPVVLVDVAGPGISRDFLRLLVEVEVPLEVVRGHALLAAAGGGRTQVHGHGRIHGLADGHVGMGQEEEDHGPRLRLGQGVFARAHLGEPPAGGVPARFRPPVLRIVAVQVQPADPVLVELAVPVAVHALGVDLPVPLPLGHHLHEPFRVSRIQDGVSLPLSHPSAHLQQEAVAVQILARVFVHQSVPVRVVGTHRAAVGLGRVQEELGAVGIVHRAQVEGLGIHQVGDLGVLPVPAHQLVDELDDGDGAGDLTRMPPPFGEHGRLVRILARLPMGDGHLPDFAPLEAPAHRVELQYLRILAGPLLEETVDLAIGGIVPEVQFSFLQRLHFRVMDPGKETGTVPFAPDPIGLRRLFVPSL